MEKYRKFADAPTGIQPFVTVVSPAKKTLPLSVLMFPVRLIFCCFFFLLVLLTDSLCYAFFSMHLFFIPRGLLVNSLRHYALRGFFFFLGHLLPHAFVQSGSGNGGASSTSSAATGSGGSGGGSSAAIRHRLHRGDVVAVNLQSPWDPMVVEIALGLPFYAVAFPRLPRPGGEDRASSGAIHSRRSAGGGVGSHVGTLSNGSSTSGGKDKGGQERRSVKLFLPGPLQRWRVVFYILYTSSPGYLAAQAAAIEDEAALQRRSGSSSPQQTMRSSHKSNSPSTNPLHRGVEPCGHPPINVGVDAQYHANRYGVPLLYFLEGTCSNGKGVLEAPAFSCYRAGAFNPNKKNDQRAGGAPTTSGLDKGTESMDELNTTDEVCRVWTASIHHQTPALATVLPTRFFPHLLWRSSCLIYGSAVGGPAPFFPRAVVCLQACRLGMAQGEEDLFSSSHNSLYASSTGNSINSSNNSDGSTHDALMQLNIAGPALLTVRQSLCRAPKGVHGAAMGGGGLVSNRKILTVGYREKSGYITAVLEGK